MSIYPAIGLSESALLLAVVSPTPPGVAKLFLCVLFQKHASLKKGNNILKFDSLSPQRKHAAMLATES